MPPSGDRSRNPSSPRAGPPAGPRAGSALAVACAALSAGCTGPSTYLDNPGNHPVYVDGQAEPRTELPFRYYGTSQFDVVPADEARGADFGRRPERRTVVMPPPASLWLFPLDFPLEVVHWVFAGQNEPVVVIAPAEVPAEDRLSPDFKPVGLELVTERALQARISR